MPDVKKPNSPHPVLASMPVYAVRAFAWTAVAVIAAAICLVLGWHDEQAWARMSAVTLVMVAAVTLGITVLCLRQDTMRRDIVDLTDTAAALRSEMKGLKSEVEDFVKRYPPVPRETERPLSRRRHGRRRPRLVEVDRTQPGSDNVVPMPSESTRKALENIRRKINGDSSGD